MFNVSRYSAVSYYTVCSSIYLNEIRGYVIILRYYYIIIIILYLHAHYIYIILYLPTLLTAVGETYNIQNACGFSYKTFCQQNRIEVLYNIILYTAGCVLRLRFVMYYDCWFGDQRRSYIEISKWGGAHKIEHQV